MENRQLLLLPTAPAKSSWMTAQVLFMTLRKSVELYLQKLHFRHMLRRNMLTGMYYGMRWKRQKRNPMHSLQEKSKWHFQRSFQGNVRLRL